MDATADSIKGKSSDDVKEMLMQTSEPESGEETKTEEQAVVETEETEVEAEAQETEEEPETKEKAEPEGETEKRYKLKVEGKEEELPLSDVLKYAQQGRYLEKEKAKLNAERKRLQEQPGARPAPAEPLNPEKLNEWFLKNVQDNPVGTLFNVLDFKDKINKENEREEKRKEREYELEKAEEHGDLWKQLKPRYQEFRDLGHSREIAEAMAQADFYKDVAMRAMQTGMKKGEKKANLKKAAEIPSGEKRGKSSTEIPSVEEAMKKPSSELKKYLRYNKTPGY